MEVLEAQTQAFTYDEHWKSQTMVGSAWHIEEPIMSEKKI